MSRRTDHRGHLWPTHRAKARRKRSERRRVLAELAAQQEARYVTS